MILSIVVVDLKHPFRFDKRVYPTALHVINFYRGFHYFREQNSESRTIITTKVMAVVAVTADILAATRMAAATKMVVDTQAAVTRMAADIPEEGVTGEEGAGEVVVVTSKCCVCVFIYYF